LQKNLVRLQSHAFCLWWSKSTCRFGRAFTFRLPVLLVTVTASPTSGQNLYLKSYLCKFSGNSQSPICPSWCKEEGFQVCRKLDGSIAADVSAINCSNTHGSSW
jgi:hypothetical protein